MKLGLIIEILADIKLLLLTVIWDTVKVPETLGIFDAIKSHLIQAYVLLFLRG